MFKFKKILVLAMVILLAAAAPAFAQARHGVQSTKGIESSVALKLSAGTWVYGIKLYADAGSSFATIYDAATYVFKTVADAVDEIGEATQYDSQVIWYPKPIYFASGVSVYIATGVVYIFYGPPPSN